MSIGVAIGVAVRIAIRMAVGATIAVNISSVGATIRVLNSSIMIIQLGPRSRELGDVLTVYVLSILWNISLQNSLCGTIEIPLHW